MLVLFGLARQQTTSVAESLRQLIDLDWTLVNFSRLWRGPKTLKVGIPYRGLTGQLHLLIDSTGINVEGDGRWDAGNLGYTNGRLAQEPYRF